MKRRNFIINTSKIAAATPFILNGINVQAAASSPLFSPTGDENDNILVIIRLDGGNDGLNSVIPIDQLDNLSKLRKDLLIPENNILKLTDTLGLHPKMTGMQEMYKNGYLNIVQGVGYRDQNRSHFRSKDIWTSASDSDKFVVSGWLGRWFERAYPDYPSNYPNTNNPDPIVISLGNRNSQTCQGTLVNFSIAVKNPNNLSTIPEGLFDIAPDNHYGKELTFLRGAVKQTNNYSDALKDIVSNGTNMIDYPDFKLADQLKTIALLISGGSKTKVYVANLGGFDTHAGQVDIDDSTQGTHSFLMSTLSSAISSFHEDLKAQGLSKRVVGFTFSEFGRQIVANASYGTDHGTAAPLFLFGDCVNPNIIGSNLNAKDVQPKDGVPMQYDFRSIYASVLMDWFDVDKDLIKDVLYKNFQHLPIIAGCTIDLTTAVLDDSKIDFKLRPNPMGRYGKIEFTLDETAFVNLSIYDGLGARRIELIDKKLSAGAHSIKIDTEHLATGMYFCRLAIGDEQLTEKMVKL